MAEAQARAVAGVRRVETRHPEASVAIVSHADVIKSVLAWCLSLSMDCHARYEVGPASVSAIVMWGTGAKVLWMNEVVTP